MEWVEGPQTPYESYCFNCRVTFPIEGRRCVHCGGRLAARTEVATAEHELSEALGLPQVEHDPDGEAAQEAQSGLRQFGGLLIWAVIALSALLSNFCEGR